MEACESMRDGFISLSFGVATKTGLSGSLSDVLKEAEELMYKNKLTDGRRARLAIVEALGRTLREKEYETEEHILRLTALAKEFARELGLSRTDTDNLLHAVRLHDIGKIGVEKDIVLKSARFSDDERSAMKKHVEIGYRIARASGEFAHIADIILCHHEWWDGRGYPHGLKGEEIPLLSRVISVLDAFDAMTTGIYRPARTAAEALTEISLNAGSQFDPALTEVFIDMISRRGYLSAGQGDGGGAEGLPR